MRYWLRGILLSLIITSMFGCHRPIWPMPPIRPERYDCVFIKNAKISGEGYGDLASIVDGKKIVFVYHYSSADYGMTDTRTWEALFFEVNPDLQFFEFTDEEIAQVNCICSITVPWSSGGGEVKSGYIVGKKLESGGYEVTVNVNLPFTYIDGKTKKYTIKFKKLFYEYKGEINRLGMEIIMNIIDN